MQAGSALTDKVKGYGMDGNDLVRVDIEGHVAKVVLNRPEKLNALNKQMWSMVGDSFAELNKMDSIRCIIFRGEGEKAVGPGGHQGI